MRIKTTITLGGLMIGMSVAALLAACSSHNNPLKTADSKAAGTFLVRASQAAEKQLHVFRAPGGYYYGECMRNAAKKPPCTKLYRAMVRYANTTTRFKGLTVSDLTDRSVFKSLRSDYQREQFNAV